MGRIKPVASRPWSDDGDIFTDSFWVKKKNAGASKEHPPSKGDFDMRERTVLHKPAQCTDLGALVAFILAIIWMFGALFYAGGHGDLRRLYHGLDYTGQLCGLDDVAQRPFVFWCTNPGRPTNNTTAHGQPIFESSATLNLEHPICVESCPKNSSTHHRCLPGSHNIEVVADDSPGNFAANTTNDLHLVQDYETYHVAGRYCFPRSPSVQRQLRLQFDWGQQVLLFGFSQVSTAWAPLLASGSLAVFFGCIFLLYFERMEQFIVEFSFVLAVSLPLLTGSILFYSVWKEDPEEQFFAKYSVTTDVRLPSFGNKVVDILVGLFLLIYGVCFGITSWCCTASMGAALSNCEIALGALSDMPSLLVCPTAASVTRIFVAYLGGVGLAWLLTCGEVRGQKDERHHGFSYSGFEYLLIGSYVFVLCWILQVCRSIEQYVIGYAVQLWYFQGKKTIGERRRDVGSAWICRGLCVGLRWHLGSLALGALFLAITGPDRCIQPRLAANRNRGKSDQVENGDDTKGGDSWLQCSGAEGGSARQVHVASYFRACWDHFVCYMHSNAYLLVAMDSNGFMAAAQKARSITESSDNPMSSSGLTLWMLHTAAGTAVAGVFAWFAWMLTGTLDAYADPNSPRLVSSREEVSILAGALAWATAQCFMACMEMISSTVLFCYMIDTPGTASCGSDARDSQLHLTSLFRLLDEEIVGQEVTL